MTPSQTHPGFATLSIAGRPVLVVSLARADREELLVDIRRVVRDEIRAARDGGS